MARFETSEHDGQQRRGDIELARNFHFNTASSRSLLTLDLVYEVAKPGHVFCGSDFPNEPSDGVKVLTKKADMWMTKHRSEEGRTRFEYGTAEGLFPRSRGEDDEVGL